MKSKNITRRKIIGGILTLLTTPFIKSGHAKKGETKMETVLHTSDSRGAADHGWLKSKHSFSFASYYNPSRMGFGVLRVINDDQIAPSSGFGTHPHQNMEIISIPISGALKHKDSEGNEAVISHGEVQLMSAGTGVYHSEYNASDTEDANFLQIWVMPEKENITPRYDQKKFDVAARKNKWQTVVSPLDKNDEGVKINQQAWFNLADLDSSQGLLYKMNNEKNGVYFFLLEGELEVGEQTLNARDAIGVIGQTKINIKAKSNAKILAMEVPLA
jgi:redox-sensitive bicupin YhaK (pirin superfamily)